MNNFQLIGTISTIFFITLISIFIFLSHLFFPVGAVWLLVLGEWKIVLCSFVFCLCSTWYVSIPMLLIKTPIIFITMACERIKILYACFLLLGYLVTPLLISIYVSLTTLPFIALSSKINCIPIFLIGYEIWVHPWIFLASKEQENKFTLLSITLLQITSAIICIFFIFSKLSLKEVFLITLIPQLLSPLVIMFIEYLILIKHKKSLQSPISQWGWLCWLDVWQRV